MIVRKSITVVWVGLLIIVNQGCTKATEETPIKPKVDVIGIYPVKAPEPCHLVEIFVRGAREPFKVDAFTQEVANQPPSNWQVPWMEQILSSDGTKIIADDQEAWRRPELFKGDVRFVFFLHHVNVNQPLITPFGKVALPKESQLPARLSIIHYEEPG